MRSLAIGVLVLSGLAHGLALTVPVVAAATGTHSVTLQVRIHSEAHAVVSTVAAGSPVHLRVTVFADLKGDPIPTGQASVIYYTDGACTTPGGSRSGVLANGTAEPAGTPVVPASAGTMSFRATYEGDATFAVTSSACLPLTVTKATPTITLWFEKDGVKTTTGVVGLIDARLTITGAPGVVTASGPIRLQLYRDATCTTFGGYANTYLTDGQFLAAWSLNFEGEYSANATYEGDANFLPGSFNGCARVTISRITPVVTTTVHDAAHASITTADAAEPVHPHATIVSADTLAASGTMRAQAFLDGSCTMPSGLPVDVAIGSTLGTVDFMGLTIATTSGSRSFRVDYLGNSRLAPAQGSCAAYTVTGGTPTNPAPTNASPTNAAPTNAAPTAVAPPATTGTTTQTTAPTAPTVTAEPAVTAAAAVSFQPAISAGPGVTARPEITAGAAITAGPALGGQPTATGIEPIAAAGGGSGILLPAFLAVAVALLLLIATAFIKRRRRQPTG